MFCVKMCSNPNQTYEEWLADCDRIINANWLCESQQFSQKHMFNIIQTEIQSIVKQEQIVQFFLIWNSIADVMKTNVSLSNT